MSTNSDQSSQASAFAGDRRRFLYGLGSGLGSIALSALLADESRAEKESAGERTSPTQPFSVEMPSFGPPRITDADAEDDEGGGERDESDDEDGVMLDTAIERLTGTDDPVGLSHVVSGVVQLTGDPPALLFLGDEVLAREPSQVCAPNLSMPNLLTIKISLRLGPRMSPRNSSDLPSA